jgi:hypothetical protein
MECEFCGENITEGALACPRCGSPAPKPPEKEPAADEQRVPEPETPPVKETAQWEIQVPEQPAPSTPKGDQGQPPAAAVWEEQAVPPVPPLPSAPSAPPGDVPLAKEEVDFIAMAEETIGPGEAGIPEDLPVEAPVAEDAEPGAPGESTLEVPPGAGMNAERVALDDSLTGGYKGGAAASSVAGAGVQTADDPFGLNITESAPPLDGDLEKGGGINFGAWYNIMVIIVAILVTGAVVVTGVYFGFLRKKAPSAGDPVATVTEYCRQVISGNTTTLNSVSVPGSAYQNELTALIEPYAKFGVLTIKDLSATASSVTDTQATVQIDKFVVKADGTGGTEYFDLLSITKPAPLRTTINLVKQNGKWLVSN